MINNINNIENKFHLQYMSPLRQSCVPLGRDTGDLLYLPHASSAAGRERKG
jgi:hypothetical protein